MLKPTAKRKWKKSVLLVALTLAALGVVVVLHRRGVGAVVGSPKSFCNPGMVTTNPFRYDHSWIVETYTSNSENSQTDDDLIFCADDCCVVLDNAHCDDWEEGHYDYFAVQPNTGWNSKGETCSIYISHDSVLRLQQTDDNAWRGLLAHVRVDWGGMHMVEDVDFRMMVLSTDSSDSVDGIDAVRGMYYKAYRSGYFWKWRGFDPYQ